MERSPLLLILTAFLVGCAQTTAPTDMEVEINRLRNKTSALRLDVTKPDSVSVIFPSETSSFAKKQAMNEILDALAGYGVVHVEEVTPNSDSPDSFWGLKQSRIVTE